MQGKAKICIKLCWILIGTGCTKFLSCKPVQSPVQRGRSCVQLSLSRQRLGTALGLRAPSVTPGSACSGTASPPVLTAARSFAPCRVIYQTPSWHLDFLACLNWLQMPSLIVLEMQRLWCQLFPSLTWAGPELRPGSQRPVLPQWLFSLWHFLRLLSALFPTPHVLPPTFPPCFPHPCLAEPVGSAWVQGIPGLGSVLGTCPKRLPQHFACRRGFYCVALMGSHAALNPKYTALSE